MFSKLKFRSGLYLLSALLSVSCLFGQVTQAYAAADPFLTGSVQACARYERKNATLSHGYKVRGKILDGASLNSYAAGKGYFSGYQAGHNYFVIAWKRGGYSALDLGSAVQPARTEQRTQDQSGKVWLLKSGWHNCR